MSKRTAIRSSKHTSQASAQRKARALARQHPRSDVRVYRRNKRGQFSRRGMQFSTVIAPRKRAAPTPPPTPAPTPTPTPEALDREYSVTADYTTESLEHGITALTLQVHMNVKSVKPPTQMELEQLFLEWIHGFEPAGVKAHIVSWQHGNKEAVEADEPEKARKDFSYLNWEFCEAKRIT